MGDNDAIHDGDNDGATNSGRGEGISRRDGAGKRAGHGLTRPHPAAYRVLIPVTNDRTGREYAPGDVVTAADFPAAVIENWLTITPPVLAAKDDD